MSRPASFVLLALLATLLHIFVQNNTLSFVPLPLYLSLTVIWLIPSPWYYLIAVALYSELFTTLPVGLMSSVIAIAALTWHFRGRIEIDLSFSFLLLLLTTVFMQIALLLGSEIIHYNLASTGLENLRLSLPLLPVIVLLIVTTTTVFLTCILFDSAFPRQITRPRSL
ncbi:MAG: hypothetical protein WD972_01140 [Candidatus Andersenbacteria bacterium]